MVLYKKGQNWTKGKTSLMLTFEKETGKSAVYRSKITGQFEAWLWKQGEMKTQKSSKPIVTKRKKDKHGIEQRHKMPEAGSAVEIHIHKVLGENKRIFYAAIIKEKFIGLWATSNAFVNNESTHFFRTSYSGGNTGAGVRPYNIYKFKKGEVEFIKFIG